MAKTTAVTIAFNVISGKEILGPYKGISSLKSENSFLCATGANSFYE
jgi:hypothetical protein